jgi:hypothetical protein
VKCKVASAQCGRKPVPLRSRSFQFEFCEFCKHLSSHLEVFLHPLPSSIIHEGLRFHYHITSKMSARNNRTADEKASPHTPERQIRNSFTSSKWSPISMGSRGSSSFWQTPPKHIVAGWHAPRFSRFSYVGIRQL